MFLLVLVGCAHFIFIPHVYSQPDDHDNDDALLLCKYICIHIYSGDQIWIHIHQI